MPLIASIDQGTSSTRFLVFESDTGKLIVSHQVEVRQLCGPHDGWLEMDANEIIASVEQCIEVVCKWLNQHGVSPSEFIKSIGITNQRETTVVWDCITGEPLYNAIVWLDTRTALMADRMIQCTSTNNKDHFRKLSGLPIHPYFSALKLKWIIENVETVADAIRKGRCLFGTVDSWLIWKLSGGAVHVTDVTNASRTLLLDIETCKWSVELCHFFDIPMQILPQVCSSAQVYAPIKSGPLAGIPLSGCVGDQQAALLGNNCVHKGDAKNTYGTGTFMLCNVGTRVIFSDIGLLSTVAYQLGVDQPVCYALEGSGSIGGNVIRFLRDNLRLIKTSDEIESYAASAGTSDGVYFVPCFTGLYTPYWDSSARGTICGLTHHSTGEHLAYAALESVCFQTCEIIEAVETDLGHRIRSLKVDGGMTKNMLFNQLQADLLGIRLYCSAMTEITGWGAAIAGAIGAGILSPTDTEVHRIDVTCFVPRSDDAERARRVDKWKDAVCRALKWAV